MICDAVSIPPGQEVGSDAKHALFQINNNNSNNNKFSSDYISSNKKCVPHC